MTTREPGARLVFTYGRDLESELDGLSWRAGRPPPSPTGSRCSCHSRDRGDHDATVLDGLAAGLAPATAQWPGRAAASDTGPPSSASRAESFAARPSARCRTLSRGSSPRTTPTRRAGGPGPAGGGDRPARLDRLRSSSRVLTEFRGRIAVLAEQALIPCIGRPGQRLAASGVPEIRQGLGSAGKKRRRPVLGAHLVRVARSGTDRTTARRRRTRRTSRRRRAS